MGEDEVSSQILIDVRRLPVNVPAPEETGDTFEANAAEKAMAYGQHVDGYLFADDSGLEVDALKGEPGVRSARFAGEHATDAANNELLLPWNGSGTSGRRPSSYRVPMKAVTASAWPV